MVVRDLASGLYDSFIFWVLMIRICVYLIINLKKNSKSFLKIFEEIFMKMNIKFTYLDGLDLRLVKVALDTFVSYLQELACEVVKDKLWSVVFVASICMSNFVLSIMM